MKKNHLIIFSLLILATFILAGCNLNKNTEIQDPENGVSINNNEFSYTNQEKKFQFNNIDGRTIETGKYGFDTIAFSPKDDDIRENVSIKTDELQKFLSVQEYYEETINTLQNQVKGFEEIEKKEVNINDMKGVSIMYTHLGGEIELKSERTFLMSPENIVYIIEYISTADTFTKFYTEYKKILQSFNVIR
ncbi:MAG TPA: DcrB-related protein [Candidatus Absconditabacterales bacterium]|nr:DcrB-related protein [Candidatus Absconditabacterales bacterium]